MAEEKVTEQTTKKRSRKTAQKEPEPAVQEERIAAAQEAPRNDSSAERTYTEAEVQAIIAQLLAKNGKQEEEIVRMYYAGVCSKENEAELPGYGVIRPGQYLEVPKKEFGGKFMSPQARKFITKRRLLVLDGLNEAERKRWNCDYQRGEVLTENALENLLDMPLGELSKLFSALCKEHKQFVARYVISIVDKANRNGTAIDNRISLPLLRTLNEAGKKDFPEGLFAQTIEEVKKAM